MSNTPTLDILHREGWIAGHAPDGMHAEKIKYKVGNADAWLALHKPIVLEQIVVDELCILEFVHDAHIFPLQHKINDKQVVQRCPGRTTQ